MDPPSFVIVFLCLGLSVFATIEDHQFEVEVEDALFYLEIVVVVWFSIEFFFRYFGRRECNCVQGG